MSKRRVGVLMGGTSAEREISLRTGEGVAKALEELGHDVARVVLGDGIQADRAVRDARIDVAFIAIAGSVLTTPTQLGPTRRVLLPCIARFTRTMSRIGMPSVIATARSRRRRRCSAASRSPTSWYSSGSTCSARILTPRHVLHAYAIVFCVVHCPERCPPQPSAPH